MSSPAHVRSIQALEDFHHALSRYNSDVREALQSADTHMRKSAEFLARRERHWQEQVRAAQAEFERAVQSYNFCRSQVYQDSEGRVYQAPCNAEAAAMSRARSEAEHAQKQLATVRSLIQQVEQASSAYVDTARRFGTTLSNEVPRATGTLDRQVAALRAYVATHAPSAGIGAVLGAALAGASMGGGAATPAAGATPHEPAPAAVPRGAIRQTPAPGIALVPLSAIDVSDSAVRSHADFLKVSHDEVVGGFQRLRETVLPQVLNGATADDFSAMDTRLGLRYADGYRRIYDAFFGNTAIRVERVGDSYRVINGFHRLSVAHELGIDEVPVFISNPGR